MTAARWGGLLSMAAVAAMVILFTLVMAASAVGTPMSDSFVWGLVVVGLSLAVLCTLVIAVASVVTVWRSWRQP